MILWMYPYDTRMISVPSTGEQLGTSKVGQQPAEAGAGALRPSRTGYKTHTYDKHTYLVN